jgi:hypothetical protein
MVMMCNGIHEDLVAQWTWGSSVLYLLQRVLLGILGLTLVVRDMR